MDKSNFLEDCQVQRVGKVSKMNCSSQVTYPVACPVWNLSKLLWLNAASFIARGARKGGGCVWRGRGSISRGSLAAAEILTLQPKSPLALCSPLIERERKRVGAGKPGTKDGNRSLKAGGAGTREWQVDNLRTIHPTLPLFPLKEGEQSRAL